MLMSYYSQRKHNLHYKKLKMMILKTIIFFLICPLTTMVNADSIGWNRYSNNKNQHIQTIFQLAQQKRNANRMNKLTMQYLSHFKNDKKTMEKMLRILHRWTLNSPGWTVLSSRMNRLRMLTVINFIIELLISKNITAGWSIHPNAHTRGKTHLFGSI